MIAGIVLAAGKSRRMGTPKAMLKWGDATFIETIVSRLREAGVAGLYVVARSDTAARIQAIAQPLGATVVINDDPKDEGPISSIRAALKILPDDFDGVMICPVDHPGIDRATYATLLQKARENRGHIILPLCQGKPGHPVVFPLAFRGELESVPSGKGADFVIARRPQEVIQVKVLDLDVLRDIDTREEYESATGEPLEEKS